MNRQKKRNKPNKRTRKAKKIKKKRIIASANSQRPGKRKRSTKRKIDI